MKTPKEFAKELVETHYNSTFNGEGLEAKFHLYSKSVKSALITVNYLISECDFESDKKFRYFIDVKEELYKML